MKENNQIIDNLELNDKIKNMQSNQPRIKKV